MIVIVNGNPRPGSRTGTLLGAIGEQVATTLGESAPTVVDVSALGVKLLSHADMDLAAALDAIRGADLLIVATPTYKASYTGVLKVLFDNLAGGALTGKNAVPVVTAGIAPQAARATGHLAELLAELGATIVPGDYAVTEDRIPDADAIAAVATELADRVSAAVAEKR